MSVAGILFAGKKRVSGSHEYEEKQKNVLL